MNTNSNCLTFLRFAAICSFLGALTTILLIFLPNPAATDFESQTLLYENKHYISKLWILFVHPQVNFLASLGVAFMLLRKYPLQIIVGTFFLLLWTFTEISQQALLIDSLNQIWRPGYIEAENALGKTMFETLIKAANGISDSKYFVVIYGFGLGSFFYGMAFIKQNEWEKWIGAALVFIGLLSLCSFARYYLGVSSLNTLVNWSYEWIYPYLQPLVRMGIGLWIFKDIKKMAIADPNGNG
ncbi:hypothetical protein ACEZ3G_09920 [Maribacter algicola]|uniref:Uncharacterized protein n=1 Tax=Meishania litoralis TaxID=3434685 RepID=A0ACC7LQE1_9FLAO